MSECGCEWEIRDLAARLSALEQWRDTVQGKGKPEPKPKVSPVEKWEGLCKERGVTEEQIAAAREACGHDPEMLAGWLRELAEGDDYRARARRGGIEAFESEDDE